MLSPLAARVDRGIADRHLLAAGTPGCRGRSKIRAARHLIAAKGDRLIGAIAIVLAIFALLWAIPTFAAGRLAQGQHRAAFRMYGPIAYGLAFIAAAWWWRAPLAEQQALRQTAALTEPDAAVIGCAEVTAAADNFERASGGELRFASDGSTLLKGSVWKAMSAEQRETFGIFATKVAECRGAPGDEPLISDIDTRDQLFPEPR